MSTVFDNNRLILVFLFPLALLISSILVHLLNSFLLSALKTEQFFVKPHNFNLRISLLRCLEFWIFNVKGKTSVYQTLNHFILEVLSELRWPRWCVISLGIDEAWVVISWLWSLFVKLGHDTVSPVCAVAWVEFLSFQCFSYISERDLLVRY